MSSTIGSPAPTHKSASSAVLAWLKARLADAMAVAEVLHNFHYAAPWDDCRTSK